MIRVVGLAQGKKKIIRNLYSFFFKYIYHHCNSSINLKPKIFQLPDDRLQSYLSLESLKFYSLVDTGRSISLSVY